MTKYHYPIYCKNEECKKEITKPRTHAQGWCTACCKRMRRAGTWINSEPDPVPVMTPLQLEIIEGHLLGDGWISKTNGIKRDLAHFGLLRTASDEAYLNWSYQKLMSLTTGNGISHRNTFLKATQKYYPEARFNTRSSSELFELRERWYPQGTKIIPKDLILTPLKIALWIADDGHIRQSHKGKEDCVELRLATNCFSKTEVDFLASLLHARYDAKFNVSKKNSGYEIITFGLGAWHVVEDCHSVWPEGMERKAYWGKLEHEPKHYLGALLRKQTHCIHGHEYKPDNTIIRVLESGNSGKRCKKCTAAVRRARYLERGI